MKTRLLAVVSLLSLTAAASAYIDLFLKDGGVSSYVFDGSPRN
jgi:hypothetical protein